MSSIRDRVKQLVPAQVTNRVRVSLVDYGIRTSDRRPLPDFLIIGTKRGGTTSLWNYLIAHPLVPRLFPAWNTKSTHYFEEHWSRGEAWYRSHFPTVRQREMLESRHGGPVRAGEAAPLYMFHPLVAARVAALMPAVRLIVLLRDPVDRAYSHWKERRANGVEPLDFVAALAAEPQRTAGERERLIAEPDHCSRRFDWYAYRARGRYLEQLEPWLERFDRGQLLVLPSEELYRDAPAAYRRTLDFLGLPVVDPPDFKVYNGRRSVPLPPPLRAELAEYYRPYNEALRQRLGLPLDWPDRPT
ncbi:Sulfotransferase domain-containing protein [Micromonospora phaseoli]|uniref:Sulfotransferase domain-containing protein n=1 Tax=Micromonospora phaseoli TaxID=1144548 RepID=A0A1H6SWJ0_9ACTN|nr:sulfotransferase domain-containing protein [Micromonospora phaseoli]PZW04100.1 sulfotransferase domain-containing protein [Micromonospora phaseoli]GIJ79687.1 deacetylase sulfotransferase [Micromonospora phaseoli]SEI71256.1 Sulfotransferase domain-containing protein [Micromonospora phaseoli]